jgi:hypothetical protein
LTVRISRRRGDHRPNGPVTIGKRGTLASVAIWTMLPVCQLASFHLTPPELVPVKTMAVKECMTCSVVFWVRRCWRRRSGCLRLPLWVCLSGSASPARIAVRLRDLVAEDRNGIRTGVYCSPARTPTKDYSRRPTTTPVPFLSAVPFLSLYPSPTTQAGGVGEPRSHRFVIGSTIPTSFAILMQSCKSGCTFWIWPYPHAIR